MLHQPLIAVHLCSSFHLFYLPLHLFTSICHLYFLLYTRTFPVTSACSQSSQCHDPNPLPPAMYFLFSVSAFNVALLLLHLSISHCHFQPLTQICFPSSCHFPLCGSIVVYTNQCHKTTPSAHISIFGTYGYKLDRSEVNISHKHGLAVR